MFHRLGLPWVGGGAGGVSAEMCHRLAFPWMVGGAGGVSVMQFCGSGGGVGKNVR